MDKLDSILTSLPGATPDVDIFATVINFMLCVLMSFIIRAFYIKYSVSLTGKNHVGVVIPILASIVFLVIMVVKSSLALSLGLVGALSIVRFRTPIKEPEELIYLFFAISIGLGYAAGHTFMTTLLGVSILAIIYFWLSNKKIGKNSEYNLVINWTKEGISFENISTILDEIILHMKLIRLERGGTGSTAVLLVIPESNIEIDLIFDKVRSIDPEVDITFYEAKTNW